MVVRLTGNERGERNQYLELSRCYRRIDRRLVGIPCNSPHSLRIEQIQSECGRLPLNGRNARPRAQRALGVVPALHRQFGIGIGSSVLRYIQGHAPISGPAFLSGVVSYGALPILALGAKVIGGNSFANQLDHNSIGSSSGESAVRLSATPVIRVAYKR